MSAVLVVTGGLFALDEPDLRPVLRKQLASAALSSGTWLDLRLKLGLAARISAVRSGIRRRLPGWDVAHRLLAADPSVGVPELTEVVLCTALAAEGVPFEVATWSELFANPVRRERLLAQCRWVLASTTLLRDVGELRTLARLLRRPGVQIIAGGALVNMIADRWPSCPEVDGLAVGWGEHLVPALASWFRAGGPAPAGSEPGSPWVLRASTERSLDALPAPDWALAERVHGRRFGWVSYESVRGCPYRCAFCNYPFLFDDNKYRVRSASRIDADWEALEANGVQWISCLDSLFTVPLRRVEELCDRLLARRSRVRWICYARADDLDPSLAARLADAGCVQVQIGAESGDDGQLARMNKRCTVDANVAALAACRAAGISTVVSVIVGFPGETRASVDATLAFLRAGRPDFCYVAPFSTKFAELPVLAPEARARFDLVAPYDGRSAFPAWRHATMDAAGALHEQERLLAAMIDEGLALDAGAFYGGTVTYRAEDRPALLAFQRAASKASGPVAHGLRALRAISALGVRLQMSRLDR